MIIENRDRSQSGNVLFLILIAVALFAALSYAVTQSTRSGGGSTDRETSILSGASMSQYPAGLRTSVVRMILGGIDILNVEFDPPSAVAGGDEAVSVFHPLGGGAVFQQAPSNLMANGQPGTWFFNANWDIPDIGISGAGGNDLIAFLPGVSLGVCRAVNDEVNFVDDISDCTSADGVVPDINSTLDESKIRETIRISGSGVAFPITNQEDLTNANGSCSSFVGHPTGCFWDATTRGGEYVFYSVLLER